MHSGAIIRAFCVDGPCQAITYLDHTTGRVLFSDVTNGDWCVYRISQDEIVETIAGCYPAAYFDRYDWPQVPGGPLSPV